MTTPQLSVLLPVYNAEKSVRQAIDSILAQSFDDFELLIIDDGCTDNSAKTISETDDDRIRIVTNPQNLGISKSLNLGIKEAQGKYIARMDADDISLPHRLEVQVDFMEANPNVGVSGGWFKEMQLGVNHKPPTHPEKAKVQLMRYNIIGHPTVILRKNLFVENDLWYNESLRYSQDYDLWSRAAKHFDVANIDDFILLYGRGNASEEKQKLQDEIADTIKLSQLKNLELKPTEAEAKLHLSLINKQEIPDENAAKHWLQKLLDANNALRFYHAEYFKEMIDFLGRKL
ncbi:MAG: glycosyltransferase [Bacteroidetes bacterium]|nr:glycosyltransferase [Bacteroidota bacterium]